MPGIAAGLHVAVPVASLAREQQLLAQARAVDVEINGLSSYWLQDSSEPVDNRAGLVLGFAAVPEVEIKAALERLGKVWNGSRLTCGSGLAREEGTALIQTDRTG